MAVSKAGLMKKVAALTAKQAKLQMLMMTLTTKKRVLKEQVRSLVRQEERQKAKTFTQKSRKPQVHRGRPRRWVGKCSACCYRHLKLAGGGEA